MTVQRDILPLPYEFVSDISDTSHLSRSVKQRIHFSHHKEVWYNDAVEAVNQLAGL